MKEKIDLSPEQKEQFLKLLEVRFENNRQRHPDVEWKVVLEKLKKDPAKLSAIYKMEETGGEPDVVTFEQGVISFCDCSPESPAHRRSCCYDLQALDERKENKPLANACDLADSIGIKMLTEGQYKKLQAVGKFDLKTSSWIETPARIRKLGGALFCDRRYDTVFVYHNGAGSYYAARGFRGFLEL